MEPMFPSDLITAIDHVGLAVADLDEAIDFYREHFGFALQHQEVNAEQGVREAMVSVGASGVCLQLLAPLSAASPIAKFLERSGPGMQQLAYRVTSIERAMAAVRATGLRLLYDEPRRGTAGSRINFIHPKDAGGVLVELVEPAPPDIEPDGDSALAR
ncbi:MAG: methylmalonyl-CoA epimerase [Nocardioidaceae bacterium]|nr:methylmalonyl-CoA epimerase [Nocardioidaceae bacterium]